MPSAALDAIARDCAAAWRTPVSPAIAVTAASANANASANCPISPVMRYASCAAFLPAARTLQRIDHFRRHVFFVVLGEHFGCIEAACIVHRAHGDDALAFAKQIRQHAMEIDRHA